MKKQNKLRQTKSRRTVALQVGFLKHLGDVAMSSSGFSLSQFVLFLHVISDRLDDDQIRSL